MAGRPARLGCLIAAAVPLLFILHFWFGWGFARTIAPVARPIAMGDLTLHLECAGDWQQSRGPWPVTYIAICPDEAVIRGDLRPDSTPLTRNYSIVIATPDGRRTVTHCSPGYRDACYFNADLRPAKLTAGLIVTVLGDSGKVLLAPRRVDFPPTNSYSLVRWEAIMGI